MTPGARPVAEALSAAVDGARLDLPLATALVAARGDQLDALLDLASAVRDAGQAARGRPGVVTWSKKVFIPVTFLCRDRCHYCVFVQSPGALQRHGLASYLEVDEVVEIARQGAALGCKEALFTLGDRPEDRWPSAREWLAHRGYASTVDYLHDLGVAVLEQTGLLPHMNPGVLSWAEVQRLRPVSPSMGMMLETTSRDLFALPGGAHFGSPDKDPAVRLATLDAAGRSRVPFSSGLLLGIGETLADRAETLLALREVSERSGHLQETIVQNFRAKARTAMQGEPDLATQEYVASVAVARLVLGPDAVVQAPPNLTDEDELALLLRAGIDDWGGVSPLTPDHVNPERPWPQVEELARLTAAAGHRLHERLTVHPRYALDLEHWVDPALHDHVRALRQDDGLADEGAPVVGRPLTTGRLAPLVLSTGPAAAALRRAQDDPAGLTDAEYVALLAAEGADLEALAGLADAVRADTTGDALTYVVNRNLDVTLVGRDPGAGGLTLDDVSRLAAEAWSLGATEVCAQGVVDPGLPGTTYEDLVRAVRAGAPDLHLHAFRPPELADGAARTGTDLATHVGRLWALGLGTAPGTGARILDDEVRRLLSGGTDLPVAQWLSLLTTVHRAGLRTTATMVYGHVETPAQQVAHLRTLGRVQDETGGFTELIVMPFVPADSPAVLVARSRGGVAGPRLRETRAVHAVARLLLHGRVDHVQAAWTKIGLDGALAVLAGGADDLGGLLLDGLLAPSAGPETGRTLARADVERVAERLGRTPTQRTTTYDVLAPTRG